MFVIVDGVDGAGKATQAQRLTDRLDKAGGASLWSFPRYRTPIGQAILRHLKNEVMLTAVEKIVGSFESSGEVASLRAPEDLLVFQAMCAVDKYDAARDISTALKADLHVVCDRWWPSAYAFGTADGLPREWLVSIHDALPKPDVSIFLDVDPAEALRRRPEARDRYERDREKQAKIRQNYRELWAIQAALGPARGDGRWYVVDGAGTVDEVHERIWDRVVAHASDRVRTG